MKKFTLTNKLFFAIFSFGLFIFMILIGINLKLTADNILRESNNIIYANVTQSSQFINTTLNDLEQIAKKIAQNKDILLSENKDEISKLLWDSLSLSPVSIQNLYFFYNGILYSNQQALLDIYDNEPLRALASELPYTPYLVWNDPYSTLISQNTMPLSYCIGTKDDYGILFIDLNSAPINQHFEAVYGNKQMSFIVYSNMNNLPLFSDIHDPAMTAVSALKTLSQFSYKPGIPVPVTLNEAKYNVFKAIPHPALSFYIIHQQQLYKTLKPMLISSFFMILGVLSLMLFASNWIAKKITTPVIQFTNELQLAYKKNSLPDTIPNTYIGEVYVMVESYNELASSIQTLVAEKEQNIREKNAYEKLALQHQIGPHFLRNTLICIGSLVKQNRNSEAIPTLQALLNLLSYSFDNSLELVTLQDEVNSVQSFVQILQVRYDQKFQLDIDIPPEYLRYQIPKLVLQPIVENAIYHGIVPKGTDGIITIHGHQEKGAFCLDITDNGIGMENPTEKMEQKEKDHIRKFSIGFTNVAKRIQLQYGSDSSVTIESTSGIGTTVHFKLPPIYI